MVVVVVVVWQGGEGEEEDELTRGWSSSSGLSVDSSVTLNFLMSGGLSVNLLELLSSEGLM